MSLTLVNTCRLLLLSQGTYNRLQLLHHQVYLLNLLIIRIHTMVLFIYLLCILDKGCLLILYPCIPLCLDKQSWVSIIVK